MDAAKIQAAMDRTRALKARYATHPMLDGVIVQLEYLKSIAEGKNTDTTRLKGINIGLIAAREIEGADDTLANMLHDIAQDVRDRLNQP